MFQAEHEDLRASLRRFVAERLRPNAAAWEDARHFPDAVFTEMAAHGFLGLKYPEALGGEGGDHLHDAVLAEELARCGSGGLAAGIGAHVGIATPPIWRFGTEDQHERFLRPAIAGEQIAALAITEPDAGSDVAAARTRAEPSVSPAPADRIATASEKAVVGRHTAAQPGRRLPCVLVREEALRRTRV